MAAGATDVLAARRRLRNARRGLAGTVTATALTARRRELATRPVWARQAAAELVGQAGQGEVALVFGNETSGLSNEEVALCRSWALIPANPDYKFAEPCRGGADDLLRTAAGRRRYRSAAGGCGGRRAGQLTRRWKA